MAAMIFRVVAVLAALISCASIGHGGTVPTLDTVLPLPDEDFSFVVEVDVYDELAPRKCLGVIYHKRKIVTTAFCIDNAESLDKIKVKSSNGSMIELSGYKKEPRYNSSAGLEYNLAILRTHEDLPYTPVCTVKPSVEENELYDDKSEPSETKAQIVGRQRGLKETKLIAREYELIEDKNICIDKLKSSHKQYFSVDTKCAELIDEEYTCIGGYGAPVLVGKDKCLQGIYNIALENVEKMDGYCRFSQIVSYIDINTYRSFLFAGE